MTGKVLPQKYAEDGILVLMFGVIAITVKRLFNML
jgi:hypothetical protein